MLRFLSTCFFLLATHLVSAQDMGDSLRIATDSSQFKVIEKLDVEASFPGGEKEWRKFLQQNLRSYVPIKKGAPAGIYTVWVQFIVNKHGNVTDVKPITTNGYGMEQEVVRIIKNSSRWDPASQNGRIVKSLRAQPVTFVVEADGFEIISKTPYVFYAGVDNPIKVKARKVKPADLGVAISQGMIIPIGNGNYIVRVNKTGKVVVQLFNKRNRQIGAARFEVKQKEQASGSPVIIKG